MTYNIFGALPSNGLNLINLLAHSMSLKNEAQSAFQSTKSFYKEYVSGMTRERIGKEFLADQDRIKQLYKEAIEGTQQPAHTLSAHQKITRLLSALADRLNSARRLGFGVSVLSFLGHYLFTNIMGLDILLTNLLLPFSYVTLLLLFMVELLEKTDVKQEIDLARQIQLSLLPTSSFNNDRLESYSFANTAHEVGGDYVDQIDTPDGLYVVIADVSGKGLTAALYMARMQALVHLLIEKDHPTPKELFLELNNYVKSGRKDKTFVTACVAFFPHESDRFTFVRAGHNPPIYFNKSKDRTYSLKTDGFALGMTSTDNLEDNLVEKSIVFEPGDSVLFYTDGLTEARNQLGEEYGVHRLESIMDVFGSLHAKTIIQKVQSSLEAFIGDETPHDDVTFTCIHRLDSKSVDKPKKEATEVVPQ
jgi:sigma-B regulation protein RsbU (phosphoserine phosphatase)